MENAPFHLAFTVNDLETTKTFYKDLLGCAVGRESSSWVDFDFFGNQISAHLSRQKHIDNEKSDVDGKLVPIQHFGVIMKWEMWHQLAEKFRNNKIEFILEPTVRFRDEPGEQATMFLNDPSGNTLEFKTMRNTKDLFSK